MIVQIVKIPEIRALQPKTVFSYERLRNVIDFFYLCFSLSDNNENHCFSLHLLIPLTSCDLP